MLYLVSTPIGNLEDISLRALSTLKEVDFVYAEDTRRTGQLLAHYEISKPLRSFHDEVELAKIGEVLDLLREGMHVALVSDAGTPLINDPGYKLVRTCIEQGLQVSAIPGVASPIMALTLSGLPPDKFFYAGYPPEKSGKRQEFLHSLKSFPFSATHIVLVSPYKLVTLLEEMKEIFGGEQEIVLLREMTKIHEERLAFTLDDALVYYEKRNPKGEFVLLFYQKV